ncbi:MAG: paraquat-inducible protein A [Planctomycetota bacterium]
MSDALLLRACPTCGRVHRLPVLAPGQVCRCTRCNETIRHASHPRSMSRTAALALAALILYPVALLLPVMTLERLGHESVASIWGGTIGLLAEGHYVVGLTVLLFSIIAPIVKLGTMFVLCGGNVFLGQSKRAAAYHFVEFIGRWGMLDVLLVAVLVAAVKLGDLVEVHPGPGVIAFLSVVVLSLLSSASFDPHAIWEDDA